MIQCKKIEKGTIQSTWSQWQFVKCWTFMCPNYYLAVQNVSHAKPALSVSSSKRKSCCSAAVRAIDGGLREAKALPALSSHSSREDESERREREREGERTRFSRRGLKPMRSNGHHHHLHRQHHHHRHHHSAQIIIHKIPLRPWVLCEWVGPYDMIQLIQCGIYCLCMCKVLYCTFCIATKTNILTRGEGWQSHWCFHMFWWDFLRCSPCQMGGQWSLATDHAWGSTHRISWYCTVRYSIILYSTVLW